MNINTNYNEHCNYDIVDQNESPKDNIKTSKKPETIKESVSIPLLILFKYFVVCSILILFELFIFNQILKVMFYHNFHYT